MLSTTFLYITFEILTLFAIVLVALVKIKKTDNSYFSKVRNSKLAFPNKQVEDVMKYIYIGNTKYELKLVSKDELDF